MNAQSRLNILLTHGQAPTRAEAAVLDPQNQPWYQSLSTLLAPMGVRTFEATTGPDAMEVIEKHPIHLAVVDTRLTGTDELSLPKLIHKIRERTTQTPEQAEAYRVQVQFEEKDKKQRIEVRFEAQAAEWPTVILLTPARNDQMLAMALKFNVFSVVNEPVDVNLMLEIMARAMRRFHQNQWPS